MSTAIYEEISNGMSQLNDALRDVFFTDGTRLFLLRRAGQTKNFTKIAEITSGYFVEWNEFREQMKFELADTDPARTDQFAVVSYLGFGVPNDQNEVDVFAVGPEERDRVPPNGDNTFWKLYCKRKPEMRYAVEEV